MTVFTALSALFLNPSDPSEFKPDIIHLASPFVLGAAGAFSARQLRIPSVALYQTDVAGFATKYCCAPSCKSRSMRARSTS